MSVNCNGAVDISDPVLEELKNREIEVGSAAFFRAYSECMVLMAAVEVQNSSDYEPRLQKMVEHLREAQRHYAQVLAIVGEAGIRPEYIGWLKTLDYERLHNDSIREKWFPQEAVVWGSVVTPIRERADAVESLRAAFIERLNELVAYVQEMHAKLERPISAQEVSMVPRAFWKLQTLFNDAMLAGQAIAIINALRPGDSAWSATTA